MQEISERRYRVHSQATDYNPQPVALTEQHSMHTPGHWEPMQPYEDHRLVDISAQSDEEYWGDLEGWQVPCNLPDCGLTSWKVAYSTCLCISKLRSCISLCDSAHMHYRTSGVHSQMGSTAACETVECWRQCRKLAFHLLVPSDRA